MSTRALYTFIGREEDGSPHNFNVYKHHDGYPTGAAQTLETAIYWFAWPLPRYESDAFAAAFCAACKVGWLGRSNDSGLEQLTELVKNYGPEGQYRKFGGNGGGVRLMPMGDPAKVARTNCSDIDYRYEIFMVDDALHVKAFTWMGEDEQEIYSGPFEDFFKWATAKEEADA